jgi:arginine exporter protein ArgO
MAAATLSSLIAERAARPISARAMAMAAHLRAHFGTGVVGILFYGAGLRDDATTELDFYVIADTAGAVLRNMLSAVAAELLPPNVYLIRAVIDGKAVAAKVAVIGRRAFVHGARAFSPQVWARFAQPAAIAYARDDAAHQQLVETLATCAATFIARAVPLMPGPFTAADVWTRGLMESYAAEWRPERDERPAALAAHDPDGCAAVVAAVLGPARADGTYIPSDAMAQSAARRVWALRRRWGKFLNVLRLMKAAFTFDGGLDYAVAKIARHSGVTVEISDDDRRHPLLAGIRVFREARRRGGVK